MRTCYLHVGMSKTGTTSIQKALFANQEHLKEHHYLKYFSVQSNHTNLISLFTERPEFLKFNIIRGLSNPEECKLHDSALSKRLHTEITKDPECDFILSGEGFSYLNESSLNRFKNDMDQHFSHYRIIIYTRHPFEYLTSYTQQKVKSGCTFQEIIEATLNIEEQSSNGNIIECISARTPTKHGDLKPYFRQRIEKFVSLFGRENVIIRNYNYLRGKDIIIDFLHHLFKEKRIKLPAFFPKQNTSLSNKDVRIIESINRQFPYIQNGTYNMQRAHPIHFYAKMGGARASDSFRFSTFNFKELKEMILEDVNWLYIITDGAIDYQIDELPVDLTPDLVDEKSKEQLDIEAYKINQDAIIAQNERTMNLVDKLARKSGSKRKKRHQKAFEIINRCTDTTYLTTVTEFLLKNEMVQEAKVALRKILDIDPENVMATKMVKDSNILIGSSYSFEGWYE